MTKARDLSKLLSTSNGKIAGSNLDVSFENISDTGTTGTKVASGTTAQRGSTTGQWRYNTTSGFFEGRNANGNFSTLEPSPTISSIDDTEVDTASGGNQTFVVTGTNFTTGGVISFTANDGTNFNATTTTHNSDTQQTAVVAKSSFVNSKEPYDIKFTSATGKFVILADAINVDNSPNWSTSAGNVGSVLEGTAISPVIQLSATDPDGDTVTYAETTTNLAGAGFTLNTTNGQITGTSGTVSSDTTTSFDVRATAGSKTTDRTFNIITKNLNENVLLLDSTNNTPWNNAITNNNYQSNSATTEVTLTNGNLRTPSLVSGASYLQSHYNTSNVKSNNQWASIVSAQGSDDGNGIYWLGVYHANSSTQVYATFDFGANPTFKFRRFTNKNPWRTGSVDYYLYGSNDVSNLGNGSSFSGTGLTQLYTTNNPASNFDSGTFTNNTYYRYYTLRMNATSGTYDYGWYFTKWYGDYY